MKIDHLLKYSTEKKAGMKKIFLLISLLYGFVSVAQVNLQSGTATADFPLFQYANDKARLNTSITLSYTSGDGLRVNELGSSVGTGWALQAGGVISRVQHGEPDDQFFTGDPQFKEKIAFQLHHTDQYYADGYMYSNISPQDPVPSVASHAPVFPTAAYAYKPNFDDREQDVYIFQFNGRTGQFVIGKNKQPQLLDDSKLRISFDETDMTNLFIRTRISSFTITDEAGIRYKFSALEVNDVMKYYWLNYVNDYQLYQGHELGSPYIRKIVTKWFLSEITNSFTNEKIIFDYSDYSVDMEGAKHLSKQSIQDGSNSYLTKQVLVERTKTSSKRIVSITFPDLYKVLFNYSATDRIDVPGDKALTEVNVLYDNKLLYGYRFDYNYFFKSELKAYNFPFLPADKRYAWLCLTDFYKTGSDGSSLPAYKFTYFQGLGGLFDIIPPAFSLYSDHWGFYNPNTKKN
jgi:hypothetical protein